MAVDRDKNRDDAGTEQSDTRDAQDTEGGAQQGKATGDKTGASDLGPDTSRDETPGRGGEVY